MQNEVFRSALRCYLDSERPLSKDLLSDLKTAIEAMLTLWDEIKSYETVMQFPAPAGSQMTDEDFEDSEDDPPRSTSTFWVEKTCRL